MNPTLETLIALQRTDSRLGILDGFLGEFPELKAALDSERQATEAEVAQKQEQLEQAKKDLRKKEQALADGEERLRQIQAKLNMVKTNKEYEAASHEINEQKAHNSDIESEILLLFDKVEEAEKIRKAIQEEWKARVRAFDDREKEMLAKKASAESERVQRMAERQTSVGALDAATLATYEKIKKARGRAVVRADKEICQGCFSRMPSQIYNEVLKGAKLISCEGCLRFLVNHDFSVDENTEIVP